MSSRRSSSGLSADTTALAVSVGLFFLSARWFTNKERQRRELGLWGAKKRSTGNLQADDSAGTNLGGNVAEGAIGSRGILALETPRVAYLEDFMYCLHVSSSCCRNFFPLFLFIGLMLSTVECVRPNSKSSRSHWTVCCREQARS